MSLTTLPARYDHVGSFLRPQYLLEARAQKAKGQITAEQLRTVEDQAIREIVKFQEDVGLKSITDGNSDEPISTLIFWSNSAASKPIFRSPSISPMAPKSWHRPSSVWSTQSDTPRISSWLTLSFSSTV